MYSSYPQEARYEITKPMTTPTKGGWLGFRYGGEKWLDAPNTVIITLEIPRSRCVRKETAVTPTVSCSVNRPSLPATIHTSGKECVQQHSRPNPPNLLPRSCQDAKREGGDIKSCYTPQYHCQMSMQRGWTSRRMSRELFRASGLLVEDRDPQTRSGAHHVVA
jgi:hypothetical protein